jgi:rod shape-determining protein MreC
LTLVLLLLTAFTLTALDYNSAQSGPLASLRRGIDTVFGPVQKALGSAASSVGDALGGLPRLGKYQSENKKLKQENDRLQGIIRNQQATQCRLDQFYAAAGLSQYLQLPTVPAQVVSVGTSQDFEWTVLIDVGSADAIKPQMTVVTGQGLVGRVTETFAHTSTVLLIADPTFTVGSTLVGQNSPGTARGDGAGPMVLSLPNTSKKVAKGMVLHTSGLGTFVAGIPIGTVTAVSPNAISRTVTIEPFVDVRSLDLVSVITLDKSTSPRKPLLPVAVGASPTSSPCDAAQPSGPVPTFTPTPSTTPSTPVRPSLTPSATPTP